MELINALSPDWKKCAKCGQFDFVPNGHSECYDCLGIGMSKNPWRGYKKQPIQQDLRLAVFARDGYACVICGNTKNLHADHVVPESKGGETTMKNLQTLCKSCNSKKGAK